MLGSRSSIEGLSAHIRFCWVVLQRAWVRVNGGLVWALFAVCRLCHIPGVTPEPVLFQVCTGSGRLMYTSDRPVGSLVW